MAGALLQLLVDHPQRLADHAQAYAQLAQAELGAARRAWTRRLRLMAGALWGAALASVLAGVALMLWAVVPAGQVQAPWALVAAPLLPALAALACGWAAWVAPGREADAPFDHLKAQLQADLCLLRQADAGGSPGDARTEAAP